LQHSLYLCFKIELRDLFRRQSAHRKRMKTRRKLVTQKGIHTSLPRDTRLTRKTRTYNSYLIMCFTTGLGPGVTSMKM